MITLGQVLIQSKHKGINYSKGTINDALWHLKQSFHSCFLPLVFDFLHVIVTLYIL